MTQITYDAQTGITTTEEVPDVDMPIKEPELTELDQMREIIMQTSADFMSFMEYYFAANPE